MLLDPIVVDPDHVAQRRAFVILFHGGSLPLARLIVLQRQLDQNRGHPPNLRKILYVVCSAASRPANS
jgi:hypothetical protein